MQIELGLIGLDLVLLVMGQELVSFKIVDAALTTEISSAKACNGPCGETAVVVALTVVDMSLRDMQVLLLSCKCQCLSCYKLPGSSAMHLVCSNLAHSFWQF